MSVGGWDGVSGGPRTEYRGAECGRAWLEAGRLDDPPWASGGGRTKFSFGQSRGGAVARGPETGWGDVVVAGPDEELNFSTRFSGEDGYGVVGGG